MKLFDNLSSSSKANMISVALLVGAIVTSSLTLVQASQVGSQLNTISENKRAKVMAENFTKDYTAVKTDLNNLLTSQIDSIGISTIYYIFSQSGKDYVITSVVTDESASTISTVEEAAVPSTTEETTTPPPVEEPIATEVPPATTDVPPATTDVPPVEQGTEGELPVEETLPNPLPVKSRTGNSPVMISFRGDVKGVLDYLDKTKLNYIIVNYNNHEGISGCTIEVKR